jgi:hypothetical protein
VSAEAPRIAVVRYGGIDTLVNIRDQRELKDLRNIVKLVNRRLTVRELHCTTMARAKTMAWQQLVRLSEYDVNQLRRHAHVLDALADLRGEP